MTSPHLLAPRLREIGPEFFTGSEPLISCAVSSATVWRDRQAPFESGRLPGQLHRVGMDETPSTPARLEAI